MFQQQMLQIAGWTETEYRLKEMLDMSFGIEKLYLINATQTAGGVNLGNYIKFVHRAK